MINKVNNNQIPELLRGMTSKQQAGSTAAADQKADASLQVSYESLIEQAKQNRSDDAVKVERARQLLMAGELDSPENIRKAAENMLKYGI